MRCRFTTTFRVFLQLKFECFPQLAMTIFVRIQRDDDAEVDTKLCAMHAARAACTAEVRFIRISAQYPVLAHDVSGGVKRA